MKKIKNERYKEEYVEETLDNGLHVVLWKKPEYEKSFFMMATPLGALDIVQSDEQGDLYEYPAGIAHFLEHKMFEMEDSDVMDEFSKLGANVNAFTSYTETVYYFSTTNDPKKPLELLLDFVQTLSITDASVEKEKGIIVEELQMYQQMPDSRLLMETYTSLFHKHPLRYDIGGSEESVRSTTLQDLQNCYERNYHPKNMVLVGVSAQDPEKLLTIIKENQNKKTFKEQMKIKRLAVEEPITPFRPYFKFSMDITAPKLSISFKQKGIKDVRERLRKEWGIRLVLDALFSSLNPEFQSWIDQGIINDFVGCDIDYGKDYGVLMFYGETSSQDAFRDIVDHCVKKILSIQLDEEMIERLKRRYFGQTLRSLNSFDDIAISFVRSYFDGVDFFTSLEVLEAISSSDIQEACQELSMDQMSIVEVVPCA